MPTRILLLTDCLEDLMGGAEKQIHELARRLDRNKFSVYVASLNNDGDTPRRLLETTGARVEIFPVKRIYGISGLRQGIRFKNFLHREKIQILVTYHFSSDIWGAWWARRAGITNIISNRRDMGFWRGGHHIRAYRWIAPCVKKIIAVAEAVKKTVVNEEGITPEKIEVIYNGIDLAPQQKPHHHSLRSELQIHPDDFLIAHIANLKPVKGHEYLLNAIAMLTPQFPNVKLALFGEDEMSGALQALCRKLKIEKNVFFLGKRKNAAQYLTDADVCVLSSLSEGMSNAILEYMSAGKAVIATSVGGNPELVEDGNNGILVNKADANGLHDALKKLILDPSLRLMMGKRGRERIEKIFSMDAMVNKYEQLFKQLSGS